MFGRDENGRLFWAPIFHRPNCPGRERNAELVVLKDEAGACRKAGGGAARPTLKIGRDFTV